MDLLVGAGRVIAAMTHLREIVEATNAILAEKGLRGLTFRAIADRLGGSTTLVTHYYSSQRELLRALSKVLLETWTAEVEQLEAGSTDARERLFVLLEWFVPLDPRGQQAERARINLLAEQLRGREIGDLGAKWSNALRRCAYSRTV